MAGPSERLERLLFFIKEEETGKVSRSGGGSSRREYTHLKYEGSWGFGSFKEKGSV